MSEPKTLLLTGDCVESLASTIPDETVDAIITDPPYEIGFMGKGWDSAGVAYDPATWRECLRVLKPGGHMVAFGATRTYHRMTVAIEDAGFEIRDCLVWLYGSGFPKSLNVSKAIDKAAGVQREVVGQRDRYLDGRERQNLGDRNDIFGSGLTANGVADITAPATPEAVQWDGWGTALKPGHEPIVLARKSFKGTVASNVLEHGTGALNVDPCRIGDSGATRKIATEVRDDTVTTYGNGLNGGGGERNLPFGRWPANVLLDPEAGAMLDEQTEGVVHGAGKARTAAEGTHSGERAEGWGNMGAPAPRFGDSGGASRFFYCAKAGTKERSTGLDEKNTHPTVKPLALMRWLVRLISPPGADVLDPFMGSGSTGCAAVLEGMNFVGIDRDSDYVAVARGRINHALEAE